MTTISKKIKSNRKNQNATVIIKTIIDNTKEHLNETDKILHFNSSVLEGILNSPVFKLDESVKIGLKYVIENNNKLISSNALFKAVEIVDVKRNYNNIEDDCN
jgi:hypothetical protein